MKRSVKILIIVLAVLILLPIVVFTAPMVYNNVILMTVEHDLKSAVKDTEGVELVDADSICGNLNGNGNKMQFLAAVIVRCDDESLVKECFRKSGRYDKEYFRLRGKEPELRCLERGKLDLDVTAYDYDDNMYLIYISSQPSDAWSFDIRAH